MVTITSATLAFLGGALPALLWLWFFLKQDRKNPEPLSLLILAFLAGAVVIFLVLPAEHIAAGLFSGTGLIVAWAAIEEILKYLAAALAVLWRRSCNEPIDAVIYMITVALGFSAFENMLFLLNPLADGQIIDSILTGNLRFLGAALLHTLSSAVIGFSIAFSFYKRRAIKRVFLFGGIILSITLHTFFNIFIMRNNGEDILLAFLFVWLGIIIVIFAFERIKVLRKPFRRLFKSRRQQHGKR